MRHSRSPWTLALMLVVAGTTLTAQRPPSGAATQPPPPSNPRLEALKKDVIAEVEARRELTQRMVDSLFSFSELGFQEFETQRYITDILVKEGFEVQRGVAGMPTSWISRFGSGRPVIALGTDVDGLPTTNQTPGVVTRRELVPGAPGHGEGHNAGQAQRRHSGARAQEDHGTREAPGTIVLWPGVAEEALGGKAHFVRAGLFKDVDAVLFLHVGAGLSTAWGDSGGSGLVSVEYNFTGSSSHAAAAPWAGKSALDAVELMNIAWNYKREHLRIQQRSHYVVSNGGDQPNVVPPNASVWYFFRETDYDHIKELWELGDTMARAAAMMTGTTVESRVLGSAWPQHGNRPIAAGDARQHSPGGDAAVERGGSAVRARVPARHGCAGARAVDLGADDAEREGVDSRQRKNGRRLGRHRRRDVERADGEAEFPLERAGGNGTSLVERGGDGHARGAQGRDAGRQGRGDDGAGPADASGTGRCGARILRKSAGAAAEVQAAHAAGGQAGDLVEQGNDGPLQAGARKLYYDPTRYSSYLEQLGMQYPPPMPPVTTTQR